MLPGSVVLDTNIVLDLLVFDDPARAQLAAAIDAGELSWLATDAMRGELARVLGYPIIVARLAEQGREAAQVLAAFDGRARLIGETPARAPCICSDPDDQMVVDLAVAHRARLLSKDRAVLTMRKRLAALGVEVSGG
jgi:putative PIN family toxin of toxin-antitoxin system